ncbi:MAG TPA: hypothetical protein VFS00_16805, partial [Polyangiaceae bacterium]|nr:hypothetical protein [Polyangiaceae bacterium]
PRPPDPSERLDAVLALYRRDRRLRPSDRPRFDFVADVAGDARPERVLAFGKDLVVLGAGFREGRGYASLGLGFGRPDDVLDVGARDLDGDGKAELVVRARQEAPAPRELGKGAVERELLAIYTVRGDAIVRSFGLETGLSLGPKRVASALVFVPEAGRPGATLVVQPGRATGWTRASWPFRPGAVEGGFEPLLLPWDAGPRRYRWQGASLVRAAGE